MDLQDLLLKKIIREKLKHLIYEGYNINGFTCRNKRVEQYQVISTKEETIKPLKLKVIKMNETIFDYEEVSKITELLSQEVKIDWDIV